MKACDNFCRLLRISPPFTPHFDIDYVYQRRALHVYSTKLDYSQTKHLIRIPLVRDEIKQAMLVKF